MVFGAQPQSEWRLQVLVQTPAAAHVPPLQSEEALQTPPISPAPPSAPSAPPPPEHAPSDRTKSIAKPAALHWMKLIGSIGLPS